MQWALIYMKKSRTPGLTLGVSVPPDCFMCFEMSTSGMSATKPMQYDECNFVVGFRAFKYYIF